MFGMIARVASRGLSTLARGTVSGTRAVAKVPIVREVAKQTAIGAALYGAGNAVFGGGGSKLPALPGGMPGLPDTMGKRGIFRNDANVADMLKDWTISKGDLQTYYRAPPGFVIIRDAVGDHCAIPRKLAIMLKLWKPAKKPPISVGDWQAVKRADRTVKKMKSIFRTTTRVDKNITGGKVNVAGKKKRGG